MNSRVMPTVTGTHAAQRLWAIKPTFRPPFPLSPPGRPVPEVERLCPDQAETTIVTHSVPWLTNTVMRFEHIVTPCRRICGPSVGASASVRIGCLLSLSVLLGALFVAIANGVGHRNIGGKTPLTRRHASAGPSLRAHQAGDRA